MLFFEITVFKKIYFPRKIGTKLLSINTTYSNTRCNLSSKHISSKSNKNKKINDTTDDECDWWRQRDRRRRRRSHDCVTAVGLSSTDDDFHCVVNYSSRFSELMYRYRSLSGDGAKNETDFEFSPTLSSPMTYVKCWMTNCYYTLNIKTFFFRLNFEKKN